MALALISARGGKQLVAMLIMVTAVLSYACKSPVELDVDRTKAYVDGAVHPTRLSVYYYFGDSAYEAIVTDTAFLNTIWIERSTTPYRLTIPRLEFSLPDTIRPNIDQSPFVRTFCFSTDNMICDGVWNLCQSPSSWMAGEYFTVNETWSPYQWAADDQGRQIRIAFYEVEGARIIKGSTQILVSHPYDSGYESYRALLTLEY